MPLSAAASRWRRWHRCVATDRQPFGHDPQEKRHHQRIDGGNGDGGDRQGIHLNKPLRQHPDDLALIGMPQGKRVEDGAGAERGDEGVDLRHLHEQPVDQADQSGACDHDNDRKRPWHAIVDQKAHRQDMPHDDAEADGEVDTTGHHRQGGGQRKQRDYGLVGEDRAEIQVCREGVRQEHRKEDDQEDGQDRQAIDRQQPGDRLPARQCGKLDRVGSSAFDLRTAWTIPPGDVAAMCPTLADAAASRFSTARSASPSSATTRPRSKTKARWHTLATSSKSVEMMMIAAPLFRAASKSR